MTLLALFLATLTGVMVPLVQSDAAEKAAAIFKVSEDEIFAAHYWGGWFHDWTPVWILVFVVALIAYSMKADRFKWVIFAVIGGVTHLVIAYTMSWVVWGSGMLLGIFKGLASALPGGAGSGK